MKWEYFSLLLVLHTGCLWTAVNIDGMGDILVIVLIVVDLGVSGLAINKKFKEND